MRTVTFSDPDLVKLMGEQFVCAWINKRPDKKYADGMYKNSNPCELNPGAGASNVTSVFANADGTVIHSAPGFLNAKSFLRHVTYASGLQSRMYAPGVKTLERSEIYASAHAKSSEDTTYYLDKAVHEILSQRLMNVGDMPLNLFDNYEPGG